MNLEQIDTSTTAGKAEVMRLAAEGRRVAYTNLGRRDWHFAKSPKWNWVERNYDIISEPEVPDGPEEVWVVIDPSIHALNEDSAKSYAEAHGLQVVRYLRADLAGEKG